MNLKTPIHARLLCRLERLRFALFENEAPSGHMQSCPDCAQYRAAAARLEEALRKSSRQEIVHPSSALEQRILLGVRRAARNAVPERVGGKGKSSFWLASLASCGAAVCLVCWSLNAPNPPGSSRDSHRVAESAPIPLERLEEESPLAALTQLQHWVPFAGGLLDVAPLEEESYAVLAEARSALQFLATSFLTN